jgi:hypothetical protein
MRRESVWLSLTEKSGQWGDQTVKGTEAGVSTLCGKEITSYT